VTTEPLLVDAACMDSSAAPYRQKADGFKKIEDWLEVLELARFSGAF
jgi:hypothetical protein